VYDEPFADSSNIPTYLLSGFARQHVKVVLSGDGGDELFGGYWWYPPIALSEKEPGSVWRWAALKLLARVLESRGARLSLQSVAAGLSARSPDPWERCAILQTQFKSDERRELWGKRAAEVSPFEPGDYYRPPEGTMGLDRAFSFDLKSFLPGDILVKVDRAAMAHGLETRTPLLDRDLVEFALSLSAVLKVDGEETKKVFRRACTDYWPAELRNRGKQGFGAPYGPWLGFPDVQALVRRVFADGSPLRRLLPGLEPARFNTNDFRKWMLLTLGLWLERNGAAA
jgi:asparagine synthase (glutamine-hydrolysing)